MESIGGKRDRLATLYPKVNEAETILPRSWNPKDKYSYIGLSNGNLKVHYKGEYTCVVWCGVLCCGVVWCGVVCVRVLDAVLFQVVAATTRMLPQ